MAEHHGGTDQTETNRQHNLRKLVATVGEKLGLGDSVLRRILNHTAPRSDVLHRHYVRLNSGDVAEALMAIQLALVGLMHSSDSSRTNFRPSTL